MKYVLKIMLNSMTKECQITFKKLHETSDIPTSNV